MDGQTLLQASMLMRSMIDVAKAIGNLVPPRKQRDEIPVYRLVPRDQLVLARADCATDMIGSTRGAH